MKFALTFFFCLIFATAIVVLGNIPSENDLLWRIMDRMDTMESSFTQKMAAMDTRFTALEKKLISETNILRKDVFKIYYNLQGFERRLNNTLTEISETKGGTLIESVSPEEASLQEYAIKKELNDLKNEFKTEKNLNMKDRQELKVLANDILTNYKAIDRIERIVQEAGSGKSKIEDSLQEIRDVSVQILDVCNSSHTVQFEERIKDTLTSEFENARKSIIQIERSCFSNHQKSGITMENYTSYFEQMEIVYDNSQDVLRLLQKSIEDDHKWMRHVTTALEAIRNVTDLYGNSCKDLFKNGRTTSRLYRIQTNSVPTFLGYCDMETDGDGWLVIQRRFEGTVDFFRTWEEYKFGFGNRNGEFWLGNELIYELTSHVQHELRIDLEDFDNEKRYAKYTSFTLGPESSNYKLTIGSYSGNAGGDALRYHNNQPFSTKDRDNDSGNPIKGGGNCAMYLQGAWWFNNCAYSSLNGPYRRGPFTDVEERGMFWQFFRGDKYSLKKSKMMIRPIA